MPVTGSARSRVAASCAARPLRPRRSSVLRRGTCGAWLAAGYAALSFDVIGMRRRAPTETIEPYRRRDEIEEGHELRGRLAGWVARKARALYAARPVMPAGIEDRNADVWEARLRIPPPRDLLRRLLDIGFGGNVACRSLEVISLLGFSAAYNMWPVSPAKWVLRRFDHSAIYLLIAGTTRHS
jgi:hypothetical protein